MTDTDYADDLALFPTTSAQDQSLLHSLEKVAGIIGLHVTANKTEVRVFKQEAFIPTLSANPLKFVPQFKNLRGNISSTESSVNICYWQIISDLEIWSLRENKTESFLCYGFVVTTV